MPLPRFAPILGLAVLLAGFLPASAAPADTARNLPPGEPSAAPEAAATPVPAPVPSPEAHPGTAPPPDSAPRSTAARGRFFRPEPGYLRTLDLPAGFRARVAGIRFDVKDALEGSDAHSRVERAVFRLANRIHIESRPYTISHRLLFREGDEVTRGLLLETEKALRSEEFLADAIIEVGPETPRGRIIKVTTYDQWTTVVGGNLSIQDLKPVDVFLGRWDKVGDREWEYGGGAWESNFLGTGTKLGGWYKHTLQRDMVEGRLVNTSVTPYGLQAGLYGAWLSDGHSYQLKVSKPLKSRADRWAFASAFSSLQLSELLYFDANVLDELPPALADSLAGGAHILREYRQVTADSILLDLTRSFGTDLKFNIGPTFLWQDRYQKGTSVPPDSGALADLPLPASALGPHLRTEALVGVSASLYQYDYKTARNFRNLKWNETVETGWRVTARAAMNQEWLGATRTDFWLAQEAAYGEAWRETWFAACSLAAGYFLAPDGTLSDGRLDAGFEGQWRQHPRTSTVLSAAWNHLFAAPKSRQLLLGGIEGLPGYPSFYFAGQARFLALAEQRFFPEFEVLTFVTSLAGFLAAGNTFPSYGDFDAGDLHYSLGLGLRLGRSKSTTKMVQHINVSWPVGEDRLSGLAVSVFAKRNL